MINSLKQNGSALIVIVIIITIAVLGILGYVGWNSFFASKDEVQQENIAAQTKPTNDEKPAINDQNSGHLSLDDWGIKFKLPENIGEVHYYKVRVENENGSFEHYEFSTARVEALGEMCVEPNKEGSATRLAYLSREVVDQSDNPHRGIFVNNNHPIEGYYYYMGGAQSMCANEGGDIQGNDRNLLLEMLKNPIAS